MKLRRVWFLWFLSGIFLVSLVLFLPSATHRWISLAAESSGVILIVFSMVQERRRWQTTLTAPREEEISLPDFDFSLEKPTLSPPETFPLEEKRSPADDELERHLQNLTSQALKLQLTGLLLILYGFLVDLLPSLPR